MIQIERVRTMESMKPVESVQISSVPRAAGGVVSSRAPADVKSDVAVLSQAGKISVEQVEQSVEKINQFFENTDYGLQFSVDNDTGKNMIKVTDRESGDVIRQLPSESMLKLSRAVGDLQGFLLKEMV